MGKGLDLGRRGRRRRHGWQRAAQILVRLALPALLLAGAPVLAAAGLAVPDWLAGRLAPYYAEQLAALRKENFALRQDLADAAPLAEENDALRALLGSPRPVAVRWAVARVAARTPGGMALWCEGEALPAGAAVLDREGRFAGRITAQYGDLAAVELPGQPGCLAGCEAGVLAPTAEGWYLTGLALPSLLRAGDIVTTLDGCWVGRLAAPPQPDDTGLTAAAPLTGTADLTDSVYFVAVG